MKIVAAGVGVLKNKKGEVIWGLTQEQVLTMLS